MKLVRYICWDEKAGKDRANGLAGAGFQVDSTPLKTSGLIGQFKQTAPAAVVIDLDRLPSHGHAVAAMLRQSPSTRHIPIVFVGGDPKKLPRMRKELPDAVFAEWKNAAAALKKAAANRLVNPAKPVPHMQRYQGSGLVTKLGLKAGLKVALIAAPEGFEELVGEWPEDIDVERKFTLKTELAIWFVRSAREMAAVADHLGVHLRNGVSAWICYPKQSGRYKVDFNSMDVRAACLDVGLVDYKICAVDADWSGMKFTRKKS